MGQKVTLIQIVVVGVVSALLVSGCGIEHPVEFEMGDDPLIVARGEKLVNGLAACGFCHGASPEPGSALTGGRAIFDKFGEMGAPNLTPAHTGLKDWSAVQISRTLRTGYSTDAHMISPKVHRGYEWLSDEDLLAIVAYVQSVPAEENAVARRELDFMDRNTTGFLDRAKEVRGFVPLIPKRFKLEYGRYLTDHVARCGSCHSMESTLLSSERYLEGGDVVTTDAGEKVAPGITNAPEKGIGDWSEAQIVEYLRTGITPKGETRDARFCPTKFYAKADPEDLALIAGYLKSVVTPPEKE